MHVNVLGMKEQPEKKFNIEWVVDIPNVIFTIKEIRDQMLTLEFKSIVL